MQNNFSAIVLAAGQGKRMKSSTPKVLHTIGDKPMILHTVDVIASTSPAFIITVVNKGHAENIRKVLGKKSHFCIQEKQRGTADATRTALKHLPKTTDTVAVFYGDDTAFYNKETILKVLSSHQKTKSQVTFVSLEKQNPQGLGRVVRKNGKLLGIFEEKDASKEQLESKEINDGLYFFDKSYLISVINKLKPSRVTGEYYLTDLINQAIKDNKKVNAYLLKDLSLWHGVNTQEELKKANKKFSNKTKQLRLHIMGVGGAGAAAVAGIAAANGYQVTGCDLAGSTVYSKNLNIDIQTGHAQSHIEDIDMLVISPAITKLDAKNEEVQEAKRKNLPVLTWQEFQGRYLQKNKYVIAVAGAYGKSTTTAMVAKILIDQKLDPTVEIGAKVLQWNSNFKVGNSNYYICESDEYNDNFLNYHSDIAVLLNIGWDHPDFFKTEESVIKSYKKFVANIIPGGTLIIPDNKEVSQLIKSAHPKVKIVKTEDFGDLNLSIIGDFRKENADAALTVAKVLDLDTQKAKDSIEAFKGLGRRLELKGQLDGVSFYDDYAVQPYTVLKTTNALKEKFAKKRVALIFEPHTFSRINKFFDDFIKSLKVLKADHIFVTDVYPAREKGDVQSLSEKIANQIGKKATYSGSIEQTASVIKNQLNNFDVILTMGAGNVDKIYDIIKNG